MTLPATCPCGNTDPGGCLLTITGYPWCHPCGEHHRPPQCAINEAGESLAPCGHPWTQVDGPSHEYGCPVLFPEYYPAPPPALPE